MNKSPRFVHSFYIHATVAGLNTLDRRTKPYGKS